MSGDETPFAGGGAGRVLRWLMVLPAGLVGWQAGALVGSLLLEATLALCPETGRAAGACASALLSGVERAAPLLGVAIGASLMVLVPVLTAPGMRGTVAWVAYTLGLGWAGQDAWMAGTWAAMLVTAVAGFVVLVVALRRWRGDGRAAPRAAVEERSS